MKKEIIVAIDVGTSGCRAVGIRLDGSIVAQQYFPLAPVRPATGLSEYNAIDLYKIVLQTLHAVLDKIGPQYVVALSVASQRSTVVLWNKVTGEPLGPVLTWEDGRAFVQAQNVSLSQEEVHAQTGLYKTPFFSAPKIAWSLQTLPQVKNSHARGELLVAPVASYIIWNLTGGKTFATDYSLAQRTLLLEVQKRQWSENLCRAFGVPMEILPSLKPSVADYGSYTYQGISIPICVCVGDQQAAAAYFHLTKHNSLLNYGTGAFWLYHTGQMPVFLPGMLTSLMANDEEKSSNYLLEGPVNSAGSALWWLKAQGISFEDNEIDTLCAMAKQPVLFLPAFGGLGAPYWNFNTSSIADGLSPHTRRADWVAGVVRSVAFLLADIGAYLRKNGLPIEEVQVSGGLSRSNYLTSFQADLLQVPLKISHQADTTVLGAALLAAKRIGINITIAPVVTHVTPQMKAEQAQEEYNVWTHFVKKALKN